MTPAEKLAAKHNAELIDGPPASGHNSGGGAPQGLKSYVERCVRLEEEKRSLAEDIKELKLEAKGRDIDTRVLGALVKRHMEDADKKAKRVAFEEKLDAYSIALGLLD